MPTAAEIDMQKAAIWKRIFLDQLLVLILKAAANLSQLWLSIRPEPALAGAPVAGGHGGRQAAVTGGLQAWRGAGLGRMWSRAGRKGVHGLGRRFEGQQRATTGTNRGAIGAGGGVDGLRDRRLVLSLARLFAAAHSHAGLCQTPRHLSPSNAPLDQASMRFSRPQLAAELSRPLPRPLGPASLAA